MESTSRGSFLKSKANTYVCSGHIVHYDPKLKTIVATDASKTELEAAMFQIQNEGTRSPVYHASKSLTAVEQNYPAIKNETLAMAWACKKLDQFLKRLPFTLETNHKPLVKLMGEKNLDQAPARIL
ncbi:hypothetical protein EB796_015792 [Bugula neritina]|uniref:Reverse transcriptase RNase H-like domain-containing protein n=1 Tax=Bugula neritina TaxID=10212 RepID=A0A7J7JKL3_BUGNE|nr:hypothetical protein EB796_015792 [Bugula neritina]